MTGSAESAAFEKKCKLFDILIAYLPYGFGPCKIVFIINKIELYAVILHLQHTDILMNAMLRSI